jgi:hypothetical protein
MLSPQEIMRAYPVGRILELSIEAKHRIKFLAVCLDNIDLCQRRLQERFAAAHAIDQTVTGEQITAVIEELLDEKPFEGMISLALGEGWNGPNAILHAKNAARVLRKTIWAVIYDSIVNDYQIAFSTWKKLKCSLLENPPGGGVLIRGYEFTEKELGHEGQANRPDVCPDFPPLGLMDEDEEE